MVVQNICCRRKKNYVEFQSKCSQNVPLSCELGTLKKNVNLGLILPTSLSLRDKYWRKSNATEQFRKRSL